MASLSNWAESILLSLAVVAVLGVIIVSFNFDYNQENSLGFTDNSTQQLFITYQTSAQENIQGGEVAFDATTGITLKSSYDIIKDLLNILWQFITGGWVERIVGYMNLGAVGPILATVFRILWFISLILIVLYILFKVKP